MQNLPMWISPAPARPKCGSRSWDLICVLLCALICVRSDVCSQMCALICVLLHVLSLVLSYARGNTTWKHSCSHVPAICNQQLNNRIELRNYIRRTSHCRTRSRSQKPSKRTVPHPPHTRGTFHRRPELFDPKNTWFCAPSTPPTEAHATSMQPLQCVWQHLAANPHSVTSCKVSQRPSLQLV